MMTLLFALVTVTHAAPVKFCLLYNVDLDDAEGVGDDYIDSNATNYHARGAWVRVKVTGGSGVWTGYLNEGPSSPGCTPTLNLALGVDHTITLKSENVVRGNYLYLYDDDSTEDPYYAIPSTTYQPPFGGETKTYILQTEDHWSNIAVASWAAWHADTGPMDPITMYMDSECPWLEGTCCDDGNLVYVGGHVLKALLAHNLGHCVWTAVGGPNFATEEGGLYGATLGPCDTVDTYPHTMVTREYQASNIWEGWAHFYWANAFNDGAEYAEDDECFVEHYNPPFDWDADGAFESGSGEYDALLSCAGSNNVEDAGNYYWDFCDGDSDPFDSVDENVNTGTEIDWLRFLWDLAWDEAPNPHGADRVLALIMGADPSGWNITGHASGAGNPYEEMEDVATSDTGWLFAWVPLQDANGVGQ